MRILAPIASLLLSASCPAAEIHVAPGGDDRADGSAAAPLRTISEAARRAVPGDEVVVAGGVYREWVAPSRGGTRSAPIVYRAAEGSRPVISGAEVVRGWRDIGGGVWEARLPDSMFGRRNPYRERLGGDWFEPMGRRHSTGEIFVDGRALYERETLGEVRRAEPHPGSRDPEGSRWVWCRRRGWGETIIAANFHGLDPNLRTVEATARPACFYPSRPGCDFITVRGFEIRQAATPWAPPNAEQVGLIGTRWSRGWVIESNLVWGSKCAGVTLGADPPGYPPFLFGAMSTCPAVHRRWSIGPALAAGWGRDRIGSHVVRGNVIRDCGQAGICGWMGAIYSRIEGNEISGIWEQRQFGGQEMAGIKLHAAIGVTVSGNRVRGACRGLWLDWMGQETRVTGNLFCDNDADDVFLEVTHGPLVLDNNLMLSATSLRDMSQGSAFIHNLFAGKIEALVETGRMTPYHHPGSLAVAGYSNVPGGDNRFVNNVFVGGSPRLQGGRGHYGGCGTWHYDFRAAPSRAAGNLYCAGATPCAAEREPAIAAESPLSRDGEDWTYLAIPGAGGVPVAALDLGRTAVSGLPFAFPGAGPPPGGRDFLGRGRDPARPVPGPFESRAAVAISAPAGARPALALAAER